MSFRFPSLSPNLYSDSEVEDLEIDDSDHVSDTTGTPVNRVSDAQGETQPLSVLYSLPPSSDGPEWSSPIVGTKQERQQKRMQKAVKKRRSTMQANQVARVAQEQQRLEAVAAQQEKDLAEVHSFLRSKGLRFGQYLSYISNPAKKQGTIRFQEFFQHSGEASQVLNWWVSSQNADQACSEVTEWAVQHVVNMVACEARSTTKSKLLQTIGKTIDQEFVEGFSYATLNRKLQDSAPIAMRVLEAFSTSPHAEKKHTTARRARTEVIVTSTALACLGEYSHSNNLSKRMLGLYLYATGAQRQTITVLSTLGLSESYINIISKNQREKRLTEADPVHHHHPSEYTGTLHQLSESMRTKARNIAAHGTYSTVYDNINMMFRNAEQIIGRHDSQENGTCATLLPLFGANRGDLKTEDYRSHFLNARKLDLTDILPTSEEAISFRQHLVFTIIRVIVNHGGEGFKRFEIDLSKHQPHTTDKIQLHKTEIYPLPSWEIDESSITGNIEVYNAIVKELRLDEDPEFWKCLRFLGGDQLSAARIRSVENIRAGQEDGYNAFFGVAWIPGLFHCKIADATGTMLTHWGKPNTGARNPGSLWFHNTQLDRLPITLTSLPSFRTCRDLIFVSLYARVLHCLLLVAGTESLEEYLTKFGKWETLVAHVEQVYDNYAATSVAANLRQARTRSQRSQSGTQEAGGKSNEGDMVFENAVLFLRDALISREFSDAVKAGDSGRVVLVLKSWALSFRGNGRSKYAYEMLQLVHNLTSVWSPEIRKIVMNNWLVNPTGKPNSWVEIDLMQEHLNYWIKVFYKAHGSNATWEWLERISPCVDVLRKLAKSFNNVLGSDQGTRHAPADLSDDIRTLMESLNENNVYRLQKGRRLDDDEDGPVKDVVNLGLEALTDGTTNPLHEFNNAFQRLQRRQKMTPIVSIGVQSPPSQSSEPNLKVEHEVDLPTAVALPTTPRRQELDVENADSGSLDEIVLPDDPGQEEMLTILTAADVELDMDGVVKEDDIVDDESDLSDEEGV